MRSGASDDIYTVRTNGSGLTRLTNDSLDDLQPTWSPNGSKIAWSHDTGEGGRNFEIYTMNASGTNRARLTTNTATYDLGPTWSPDGTKLAWATSEITTALCTDSTDPSLTLGFEHIQTMNANGTAHAVVSYHPGAEARWGYGSPTWRNGRLAFTSENFDTNSDGVCDNTNGDIYTGSPAGGGLVQLTSTPAVDEQHPSMAPDASAIVFTQYPGSTTVYKVSTSGGTPVVVANGFHPAWQQAVAPK